MGNALRSRTQTKTSIRFTKTLSKSEMVKINENAQV